MDVIILHDILHKLVGNYLSMLRADFNKPGASTQQNSSCTATYL